MPFLGELSAFLTACLWSCGALAFAAATQRAGSFQVNVTRLILAAVYLILLTIIAGLEVNLSSTQVLNLGLSGVVGLTFGDTFLFKAFQEIGARVSMLIMSLSPAIAALLAFLVLQETLPFTGVLGILVTILGISVVVTDRKGSGSNTTTLTTSGLVYAALAAVGQGGGLILAKMAFREGEVNGFVATGVRIIASLVLLVPIALMTRRYHNPVRMYAEDRRAFLLTALGSILGPFLGISFSLIAIEHTKVGIAATIMALVPVLMLPLVKIVHKEVLSWRAIVGAFTAVAGVAMLFLRQAP
jgi:drug/metabolite transporter (DMT)-like permease